MHIVANHMHICIIKENSTVAVRPIEFDYVNVMFRDKIINQVSVHRVTVRKSVSEPRQQHVFSA